MTIVSRRGFSLLEVLIVVAIMGIMAALAIPSASSGIVDQLEAAARIVATDVAYCRNLAVANASQYEIKFVVRENRYLLRHTGTNPALDNMPPSPFRAPDDPATEHRVALNDLPALGGYVQLAGITSQSGTPSSVNYVEFGPLGETTRTPATRIWLAAGDGDSRRYIPITVDPVTGIASIGAIQADDPTGVDLADMAEALSQASITIGG